MKYPCIAWFIISAWYPVMRSYSLSPATTEFVIAFLYSELFHVPGSPTNSKLTLNLSSTARLRLNTASLRMSPFSSSAMNSYAHSFL